MYLPNGACKIPFVSPTETLPFGNSYPLSVRAGSLSRSSPVSAIRYYHATATLTGSRRFSGVNVTLMICPCKGMANDNVGSVTLRGVVTPPSRIISMIWNATVRIRNQVPTHA
jgi:hypothetical protein